VTGPQLPGRSAAEHRPSEHGHAHHAGRGPARHAGHSHGASAGADRRYLGVALGLIVAFMVVEVVVAFLASSLALLADAGHMLTDAGALAGAMWAASLAGRPAVGQLTFGFKRAEILSAAVNGVTLLVVAALVAFEAVRRLAEPAPVGGGAVIAVAALGVVVNVVATWVLAKANRSSLNIEGAFQHLLTDTYAFFATLVAGLVIVTTGFVRADAIASLVVVALMLRAAWQLLRASGRVLLEAAPEGVDLPRCGRTCCRPRTYCRSTTCTPGSSPATCRRCPRTWCWTTRASAMGTPRRSWTTCSTASRATSTSSTRPSSSNRPGTPRMRPAPTHDGLAPSSELGQPHLIGSSLWSGTVQEEDHRS